MRMKILNYSVVQVMTTKIISHVEAFQKIHVFVYKNSKCFEKRASFDSRRLIASKT